MRFLLAVLALISLPFAALAQGISIDLVGQVRPYAGQSGPPCTYICAGLLNGGLVDWLRVKSPDLPPVILSRASAADCAALSPSQPPGQGCWVIGPDRDDAADMALTFTDTDAAWDITLTDAVGNTRMQASSVDFPGMILSDFLALSDDNSPGLAEVLTLNVATGFNTTLDFPTRSALRAPGDDCPFSHPDYATMALSAMKLWPLDTAPMPVASLVDFWARDVSGCMAGDTASDAAFRQLALLPRARHLPGLKHLLRDRPAILQPSISAALQAILTADPSAPRNLAYSVQDPLLRASADDLAAAAPTYRAILDKVPDLPVQFYLPIGRFDFDPAPYLTAMFRTADTEMGTTLLQAACLADPQWNQSLAPVVRDALLSAVHDPAFAQGSHHEYDPDLQYGLAALRRMGAMDDANKVVDALNDLGLSLTPQTFARDLTDPLPEGGPCSLRR